MPGRISDADIAEVRSRSQIADVVGEYVALRRAGGDALKGLCPFHEEKTPSFNVRPSTGYYHCFGCAVSGDVIDFIERIEHLSFVEAVERLADKVGIHLRYEQGGMGPAHQPGGRARLLEAHRAAAEFYTERLAAEDGKIARDFLTERGFDADAAKTFGCGFAPVGWDLLTKHLLLKKFTPKELETAGLSKPARSGSLIDRFRRRLVWPIRSITGDVVGFGARRLFDDDDGPKYLNTPETPIYKKSEVLYGVDLAKREIARRRQAVVVEGYTDVMACHLAGVPTAVATCGTAFGSDHIGVLRRLLMDSDSFRGEVIFTFDGDEAGRKAALRAFDDEQRFVAQTFVAVEAGGMDPCELRQGKGDAAVRDLVAQRVPLVQFALRSTIDDYDLETVEGRVQALRSAAPLVAKIKDQSMRPEYARKLAGDLGMEVDTVLAEVRRNGGGPDTGRRGGSNRQQSYRQNDNRQNGNGPGGGRQNGNAQNGNGQSGAGRQQQSADVRPMRSEPAAPPRPRPDDPRLAVEREVLKIALQTPALAGPVFDAIATEAYTHPVYGAVRTAIEVAGGVQGQVTGPAWIERASSSCPDEVSRSVVSELAVERLRCAGSEPTGRYVQENLARLQELAVERKIAQVKSTLQRINPVERAEDHTRLFGELIALEQQRRGLREQAMGEEPA
ncbi:MAG TPA: DNA primase [Mycobacteriales bacterium]|nr:DNA primase [Mycobacteriales bacterium]